MIILIHSILNSNSLKLFNKYSTIKIFPLSHAFCKQYFKRFNGTLKFGNDTNSLSNSILLSIQAL